MRKSKGLTQKELAEKLNLTDKAVSKWERGLSSPDVALLLPLSQLLGISTDELLAGDCAYTGTTADENNDDEAVSENIDIPVHIDTKNDVTCCPPMTSGKSKKILRIVFAALSAALILAVIICFICDFCLNSSLSWSLIVLSSSILAWLMLLPVFTASRKMAKKIIAVLTIAIIPYLFTLGILLDSPEVLRLGAPIAAVSIIAAWCIYALFDIFKSRKLIPSGLCPVIVMCATWCINLIISRLTTQHVPLETRFIDFLLSSVAVIAAAVCFAADYCIRHYK